MNVNWFELAYTVIGGLGIFLFGMKILSESLQAVASDFIRNVIGWLTNNRFLAVIVGLVVTMIVQSSSITTVMVVGFVNAGLMTLKQAIGVIFGANIGTTITGWIIAIKVGKYGLLLIAGGLVPYFFFKRGIPKNIGKVLIALGFIFLGLLSMKTGFKPLGDSKDFQGYLTFFAADNIGSVLACVGIGCLLTLIVQSSSAMLGITIALAVTGTIEFPTAAALVFGENIGTTITALLASIGGNINAKRAAYAHTVFNVLGVCVMMVIFQPYIHFIEWIVGSAGDTMTSLFKYKDSAKSGGEVADVAVLIAASHSFFNITNTLVFIPLLPQLARLVTWMRPDKGLVPMTRLKLLGNLSQVAPELAIEEADGQIAMMSEVTKELLEKTRETLDAAGIEVDRKERIDHLEHITDNIHKEVTIFLCSVLQVPMTQEQSLRCYSLIRISDELESVADYCQSISIYKQRQVSENQTFSDNAREELQTLFANATEFVHQAIEIIEAKNPGVIRVDAVASKGDALGDQADAIRAAHLDRVKEGVCDGLAGLTFSDMIVAIRRIKNHAMNMLDAKVNRWEDRREGIAVLDRVTSKVNDAPPPAPKPPSP